jgi:hypothetical protein
VIKNGREVKVAQKKVSGIVTDRKIVNGVEIEGVWYADNTNKYKEWKKGGKQNGEEQTKDITFVVDGAKVVQILSEKARKHHPKVFEAMESNGNKKDYPALVDNINE